MGSPDYEQGASGAFSSAFEFVEKYRKFMLAAHLVWFLISAWLGPQFLTYGNDQVTAPSGSKSEIAERAFQLHFPELAFELPDIVVIECVENHNDLGVFSETRAAKGCSLLEDERYLKGVTDRIVEAALKFNSSHNNVAEVQGYFQYKDTLMDGVKDELISEDKKLTFLNFACKGDAESSVRYDMLDVLEEAIEAENVDSHKFKIRVTGFDAMLHASIAQTQGELEKIDSITVPLAMLLLALMIRSWRLLLIASFNMMASIAGGFALLVLLMNTVISARPENSGSQLAQVMIMATSIDYSLFLLRRFRDELKVSPHDVRRAVFLATLHSGHVVVMSGFTIVFVFAGFAILPAEIIQMDGVCCALGVTFAMVTCLTATPAFLLEFPGFFSNFSIRPFGPRWGYEDAIDSNAQMVGGYVELAAAGNAEPTHNKAFDSPRFRFTRKITKWPFNVVAILVLYALVVPLFYKATDIKISQDVLSGMPRDSPSSNAYKAMERHFPPGLFAPFYVIAVPKKGDIKSEEFFKSTQRVLQRVYETIHEAHPDFTKKSIASPTWLNGVETTWGEAKTLLDLDSSWVCEHTPKVTWQACSAAREFAYLWKRSTDDSKHSAMLIQIVVPFFPFDQQSHAFINSVYDALDEFSSENDDFYFSGFEVAFDAVETQVYKLFPYMLLGISLLVFTFLGVLLRSAFVPVRLMLTLFLPIGAIFGLGVMVYQEGVLEWTNVAALSRLEGESFFYYVPILIISISIALALDYDVLLVARVMEHRKIGYDGRAAICKAVTETGSMISVAGLIMVLCFGGLLLSSQSTANACGFMLATAVLLDTFVVNTVLVPAVLSLGDSVAWWPTKMPTENLITLQADEFPSGDE